MWRKVTLRTGSRSRKVQSPDEGWDNESQRVKGVEWDRNDQLKGQWRPAPKNELPASTHFPQ